MENAELQKKIDSLLNADHSTISVVDVSKVLQDLKLNQGELELQNSELRAAQAEIESLRQRYYDLFIFAPVGYLVVDANGIIKDVNLTACQLLGQERRYVISTPLSKYFSPKSRSRFFEILNTVFEIKVSQQTELVLTSQRDNKKNTHVAATIQTFYEDHHHLARLTLTDISEHVRSEKEKLEQYNVMFETSHFVKLLIDPETGDIVDANQKACQFYGYNKDILTGMKITDINQLSTDETKREMQQEKTEQRQHFHFRHRLASGESRDVQVFSDPIEIGGRTLRYSIIHDITELLEQESERHLLWHAVEQNSSSIIITNTNGDIEYVNPHFTKVSGYSPSEVIGKNPSVLKSGHTSGDEYAELWETVTSGREWVGEFHNKKKNGELFWESAIISPVTDMDGTITHFVAIKQDITAEKQALEALKQKESMLRYSQEIARIGAWTWDLVSDTIEWGDGMYSNYGSLSGGFIDVIEQIVHEDDRERVIAEIPKALESDSTEGVNYRIVQPDGSVRHIWWLPGEREQDADGNTISVSGIVQDITERKQDADQLQLEAETQAVVLSLLNSDTPDQDSFIERALEEAVKLTNSTIGYFHFVNSNQVTPNLFKWSKGVMDQCTVAADAHYPLEQAGIWADCIRTQRPAVHNDYANLDDKQGLPEGDFPLIRHVSVPIMKGDKPVAVLGVGNKSQDYSDLDVARLTLMSTTLWTWIESKRAVTEIRRQNSEIRAINHAISISISTLDTEEIANIACRELASVLEAVSVVLATLDENSGDYRVIAASSIQLPDEDRVGTLLVHADDPILDTLKRYRIPQIVNDLSSDLVLSACNHTSLIVPVNLNSSLFGVFCAEFEQEQEISDRELRHAANIVQVISQGLENSLLHQEIAEHNKQLNKLVDERTVQLRRTNNRLKIVLDNVTNPILLIDAERNIAITNPAFNRKLGYETDELFGYPVIKIFGSGKRSEISALLNSIQEQQQTSPTEAKIIAKDGTLLDVEVAFAFVEGNTRHVVCTLYDISHIKEVERIKDQFVAMVGHELRTPITSMLLSSSTMKNYYDRLSDEQKQRKITQINQQAQLLSELVTAILDTSRIDSRLYQRGQDSINLADILRQVVDELKEQAVLKQQKIDVEIANDVISVPGARLDITRIWHNLLSNAIKYTQEGGHISVRLFGACTSVDCHMPDLSDFVDPLPDDLNDGHYIIGIVQDNGHGIRAGDMPQLFTRFFRGWAAGTLIHGTGLGLSLLRELLQLYDGDITVRSELGVGTTFCFWLPVEETKEAGCLR